MFFSPLLKTFNMSKQRKTAISTISAQITSTISVAMVLLILGIVAVLGFVAQNISHDIKENFGFVVTLKENISQIEINALKLRWAKSPYVASQKYTSAEEVLHQQLNLDESILDMTAGINPYLAEFEIKVKPEYASHDSTNNIKESLLQIPYIKDVLIDQTNIDSINKNANNIISVLFIIATIMLLISFVLINNTIRLSIYSKRFTIHTMKLVGATNGFIRRPIILNSIIQGIIAAIIAILLLIAIIYYLPSFLVDIKDFIPWEEISLIFGGLIIIGITICATTALFATNKYLRTSYDNMFK